MSYLDRQLVWKNKHILGQSKLNVTIREHFAQEVESNIRTLLPIRKRALESKLKVRLLADKLYINSQLYTVHNLHTLPDALKPDKVAVREENNHLFFFSSLLKLSNFHPSSFTVGDTTYLNSEQYIQSKNANLFKSPEIVAKVMATSNPVEMKRLARKLPQFSNKTWEEHAPDIAHVAILNKFSQNEVLKQYLISTGNTILVEASPYDKVWGIGMGIDQKDILKQKSSWGKNLQGSTLMRVRRELSNPNPSSSSSTS